MWLSSGIAGIIHVLSSVMIVGMTVILHSTIIMAAGIVIFLMAKKYGLIAQSYVLRVTIVLAIALPPLTVLVLHDVAVTLPMPRIPANVFSGSPETELDSSKSSAEIESPALLENITRTVLSAPPSPQQSPIVQLPVINHSDSYVATETNNPQKNQRNQAQQVHSKMTIEESENRTIPMILLAVYAIVIGIWIVSSMVLALQSLREYVFLRRFRSRARPASKAFRQVCHRLSNQLKVKPPLVRQAESLVSPLITGIRKPVILLPDTIESDLQHQHEVLLHELTHLKRHDPFWSYLRQLMLIIIPIQPLAWFIARQLDEISDYICDAVVTSKTHDCRSYATTLFTIASRYQQEQRPVVAGVGFFSFTSPLKRRIERILSGVHDISFQLSIRFMTVVSIFCTATAAITGIVSFEECDVRFTRRYLVATASYGTQMLLELTASSMREYNAVKSRVVSDGYENSENARSTEGRPALQQLAADASARSGKGEQNVTSLSISSINGEMVNSSERDQALSQMAQASGIPDEMSSDGLATVSEDGTVGFPEEVSEHTGTAVGQYELESESNADFTENIIDTAASAELVEEYTGLAMTAVTNSSVGMPDSRPVQVNVPDYENGMFDLNDPEQLKQYNLYASLDKNKTEPTWSPDGKWIVFTDQNCVWMVSVSGGEPILIFENVYLLEDKVFPIGGIESISFLPDGKSLVFKMDTYDTDRGSRITTNSIDETMTKAYFEFPIPVIVQLDIETNDVTVLVDGGYNCAVSPDGLRLCYLNADLPADENDLSQINHPMLLDLITGDVRQLNNDINMIFGKPTFTPDGVEVIIPSRHKDAPVELSRISLEDESVEYLTQSDNSSDSNRHLGYPTVSPDGEWVLYTDISFESVGSFNRLMLYSIQSGERYELFPDAIDQRAYGAWSPDGNNICYLATENEGKILYVSRFEPGAYKISVSADVDDSEEPTAFSLGNPYPNPFNSNVTLQYVIPEAGTVKLIVYNMMGQEIKELISEYYEPGMYTANWDGYDNNGQSVSSGVYIARLLVGKYQTTQKMTFAK